MSHANSLPPELTEIESQLCGLPIPSTRLNRDETLYQSGWAAAEAHQRWAMRGRWLWPTTSSVLAASVVVLSVLLVQGNGRDAPTVVSHAPHSAAEQPDSQPSEIVDSSRTPSRSTLMFVRRYSPDDQSLLAVRERALRGVFAAPSQSINEGDITIREPKTNRELLDELLTRSTDS